MQQTEQHPAILVLDPVADEYRELLKDLPNPIEFATEAPEKPDQEIYIAAPQLAAAAIKNGGRPTWVQSTWAGIESLIPTMQAHPDILVTGLKDVFGHLAAEFVFAYILQDVKRVKHYADLQASQTWDETALPGLLRGQTLTLIGMGSIAHQIAHIGEAFGMKVQGFARSKKPVEAPYHQTYQVLADAVANADYVVACLPATPATYHLINGDCFSAMKPTGMFLNIGRGATVNMDALVAALNQKTIRAAMVDVLETEPLAPDSALWSTPGLTITPHVAAATDAADVCVLFRDNYQLFQRGEPLKFLIDANRGY